MHLCDKATLSISALLQTGSLCCLNSLIWKPWRYVKSNKLILCSLDKKAVGILMLSGPGLLVAQSMIADCRQRLPCLAVLYFLLHRIAKSAISCLISALFTRNFAKILKSSQTHLCLHFSNRFQ